MNLSLRFSHILALLAALAAFPASASAQGFANSAPVTGAADYTTGEKELLEKLRTAEPADKAVACKQLAIHGTKAAVPELAKLLADPQLASWSRIALEAIPDPAADEALLKAAETLDGQLLVGVINSLGVRRYAAAADQLATRLKDNDAEVASAAAVALGRIANDRATATLRQSLASSLPNVRSAIAEGLILCAERLTAEGKTDEAAALYEEIRKADVPKPRILEATRGAILAGKAKGLSLLQEELRSPDKARFYIALTTSRELKGAEIAELLAADLAADLAAAKPDRAVALIASIADRNEASLPPAVLAAAKQGDAQVRIAAINALGRSPQPSNAQALLELSADAEAQIADAAIAALANVPGTDVNEVLVAGLPQAKGKALAALIEIIGQRRLAATAALTKATENDDDAIRHAALVALGETIAPQELPVLIAKVVAPNEADAAVAAKALRAAAVRMPDREATAAVLAAAMPNAPAEAKIALIDVLGAMGGPVALETIVAAVKGGDEKLFDAGTRALGGWMTVDAGPALLAMAQDPANKKFQVRALRGYLRLARQFTMPIEDRAAMCKAAMAAATRPDEKKLTLQVLSRYPSPLTLDQAILAKKDPALKADAALAAMIIVQKLAEQGADSRQLIAKIGEKPVDVEIVKAEYGSGEVVRDVTQTLQQQVRGLPLITLPASTFNKSFGGDPAPSMTKALKVHYRINGKAGDASFPENTVIVLPMPQ